MSATFRQALVAEWPMSLTVREMAVSEVELVIDYFHASTPEHLELIGVDPKRLPQREDWRVLLRN